MFFDGSVFFLEIKIFKFVEFRVVEKGNINFLSGLLGVMVSRVIFIFIFWFIDICVFFSGV